MNFIQKTALAFFLALFLGTAANAQMIVGQDTLYGNEWINYTQKYYKIRSLTQGMVRLTYTDLLAGLGNVGMQGRNGSDFQMFYMGKEVPINVSTGAGPITSLTYIEYYSRPHPAYIDQFLVSDTAKYWFSPNISTFGITAPYFLTWRTTGTAKRYTETDNGMAGTLPTKENFYIAESGSRGYLPSSSVSFLAKWSEGIDQGSFAQLGGFEARGFAGNFTKTALAEEVMLTNMLYTGSDAPNATVKTRIRLYENKSHNLNIYLNNTRYVQESSTGYSLKNYTFSVPAASLVASNAFKVQGAMTTTGSDGQVVYNDYFALANAVLRYPRQFDFEGKATYEFEITESTTAKYIEVTNFNHSNLAPIVYDHTNGLRIATVLSNGIIKFVLPPSTKKRFLTMRSAANAVSTIAPIVTAIGFQAALYPRGKVVAPVSFVDYSKTANQGDYIIISNRKLFNDSTGNWVKEYAAYRSQTSGYDTLVVEMDQLYDQYAYGVDYNPLSIRNFSWFSKKKFAVTPKYVFLIGKGYWSPLIYSVPMVPGFGYPASDNLMMAGHKTNVPVIPFGRLAAQNGGDIRDYLSKIREHEAAPLQQNTEANKAWMKKVIHLIGAENDPSIPVYMNGFKNTIEAPSYAGKVFTFIKNNTDPVHGASSVYLDSLIRTGCSIINMFGHAYADGTDYDLEPSRMNNKGKYPLVFSLGCFSGDMFYTSKYLSERFVLQPNAGSIGFMASVHLNTSGDLNRYTSKMYRHISTDMYGKGFGDIVRQTIADDDLGNPIINQNLLYQGDPAVRLYPFAGPDYIVRDNSIRLTPSIITTIQDSFRVDFTGMNIGKGINDSINIKITRTFPQFGETTTVKRIKAPVFDKGYFFNLPVGLDGVYGTNAITICMDAANEVSELPLPLAESNNCKRYEFQIYSNLVLPVYPSQFGIHNKNTVTLRSAATNPLGAATSYTIEIDTTERFNSPLRRRTVVPNFSGGLLEWDTKTSINNTQLVLRDSAVYYWRVKVTNDSLWQNSSFVYLNNEYEGWNQSHYYQYLKDQFFTVKLPDSGRKFGFIQNGTEFRVNSDMTNPDKTQIFMNGTAIVTWYCRSGAESNGVTVHVIDPITGIPWKNPLVKPYTGQYGSDICSEKTQYGFVFHTNDTEGRDSVKRLLSVVPDGHYVLIWSHKDMKAKYWRNDPVSLGNMIRQQSGSTLLAQAELPSQDSASYAILYRKNTPSFPIKEILKTNPNDPIVYEQFLVPAQLDRGTVNSTIIGPAVEWGSFHWKTSRTEANDVTSADIYGIKSDNTEVLLMPNLRHANQANTSTVSLSGAGGINAATYPRLRLVWNLKDTLLRTAPNLDYWRVLYKQIPEVVLRPELFYSFERDTIVERGETVRIKIEVENITNTDMDSLRVKYAVRKPNGVVENKYIKFGKLLANTKLRTDFSYNTRDMNLAGENTIGIDVNPQDAQEQREQYHFNNTGSVRFRVNQDIKNPLLDVTFDGIHILDNDLISSKPTILVTLKDENKYLSLADTAHFRLYLEDVTSSPILRRQIYFTNNNEIRFYPADAASTARNNNKARVEYTPIFPKDGTYILYVQGTDVVGNESGKENYKVHFRISNKAAISQVLNYPNPFTTRTQFVFTLTGNEIPEEMTIQIFTVTGQLVRTITKAELGAIHIGLNRTEFAWDGTDEYGDRLANGVYLYRVISKRSNGQPFDFYEDKTPENTTKPIEQLFQNGYGKMYMMR